MLLSNGDGTFQAPTPINVGNLAAGGDSSGLLDGLAVGDFNDDGRVDLALAGIDVSNYQDAVEILLGNGDGTFQAVTPVDLSGVGPGVGEVKGLVAGDFNDDRRTDLAVVLVPDSSGEEQIEVLMNDGDGLLHATAPVYYGLSDFVSGNFNGDGYTDLAAVAPLAERIHRAELDTGPAGQRRRDVSFRGTAWSVGISSRISGCPLTSPVTAAPTSRS